MTDAERRAALMERMAEAMCEADKGMFTPYEQLASAALDLALEEAAKVAEEIGTQWLDQWRKNFKCDSHLEGKSDGADEIAAAIRALKGET